MISSAASMRRLARDVYADSGIRELRAQVDGARQREYQRLTDARCAMVTAPSGTHAHDCAKRDVAQHQYALDLLRDIEDGLVLVPATEGEKHVLRPEGLPVSSDQGNSRPAASDGNGHGSRASDALRREGVVVA